MTPAETFLWSKIRRRQIIDFWFYRQKPIGIYIADFYCPKAKLVIEVDGNQHLSDENVKYDKERKEYMKSIGLRVLRFKNAEILTNIDMVVGRIESELTKLFR